MLKAIKEAKVNSSWVSPNEIWEDAVRQYVATTLEPDHWFRQAIGKAAEGIAWHGMLNSLTQTILKLTCPGVPDFFQGSELWDLRLVDPDNRGPIDYSLREKILAEVTDKAVDEFAAVLERWGHQNCYRQRSAPTASAVPSPFSNRYVFVIVRQWR